MDNSVKRVTSQIRKKTWIKNISDRNASGLSIKNWCFQNGINETSYYYWLKKIRCEIIETSQAGEENNLTFVPMLSRASDGLTYQSKSNQNKITSDYDMTITVGNMTIGFGNHASPELILNVLKVLKDA